ncbi:MAG: hypothetical protein ACT4P5_22885, partial [Armatimonadota bacterium]
ERSGGLAAGLSGPPPAVIVAVFGRTPEDPPIPEGRLGSFHEEDEYGRQNDAGEMSAAEVRHFGRKAVICQNGSTMVRKKTTVYIEEDLLKAARIVAER